MRPLLAATLMIASVAPAIAQIPPAPAAKPKPAAAAPARPALQTPADTANAMAQAERTAIQSDLAWAGQYNGAINGEVGERMVAAIKAFQKDNGAKQTGVLNPQERGVLADAAKKRQANVGWKIVTDMVTGARLGLPAKLVPQQASDANGSRWSSTTGTIQIQLSRRKDAAGIAKLAEQERRETGRRIDYSAVKPDFFVLSGMQGLKKFYLRGQLKDGEVRILTILYDQATEGTMEPVVIAMSSAFIAFPASLQGGAQAGAPPPRKAVEYGTGIVVSGDGAVLTDRQVSDGCTSLVIAGHGHAERVAEDAARDLALLRIYGSSGLKPLAWRSGAAKPAVDVTGIADPQNQGGNAAVTGVRAMVTVGAGGELALSPAPGLGFSGAVARDADGGFAGIAQLRPVVAAGPPSGAQATQAVLVSAPAVRDFLKANGIDPAVTSDAVPPDAKASVVRVICVRK